MGAGLDHRVNTILKSPANFRKVKQSRPLRVEQSQIKLRSSEADKNVLYDLALLELEQPWAFNDQTNIYPACLMDFDYSRWFKFKVRWTDAEHGLEADDDGGQLLATGYGRTEPQHYTFPDSPNARQITSNGSFTLGPSSEYLSEQWQLNFVTMKHLSWPRNRRLITVSNPRSAICFGMFSVCTLLIFLFYFEFHF